jgi:hypothetical protein
MKVLLNPRIWLALAVLLAIDTCFQLGGYSRLASRNSHSGTTLRTLNAMNLQGLREALPARADSPASSVDGRRDTVTIGSSVAVYGLDHARIAAAARQSGHQHSNLSLPGSALLTFRQWASWLPVHAPKVHGGLIVMAPGDVQALGNGSYELAIVAPLKSLADGLWWHEHVPFARDNLETYGLFSGLALYRNDLQQLIAHPWQRRFELRWWRTHLRESNSLSTQFAFDGDLCGIDLSSTEACIAAPRPDTMPEAEFQAVQGVCQTIKATSINVPDWTHSTPPEVKRVQTLRREIINSLGWRERTLVLVLPMHPLWRSSYAKGAQAALTNTYAAQVASGAVRYLDYQNVFDDAGVPACKVFHDMYHLNRLGQSIVTDKLLPEMAWLNR